MTLQNYRIWELIKKIDEDEGNAEKVMKLSQKVNEIAMIFVEQGVIFEAKKECYEFLNIFQNDIFNLNGWQDLYSCLVKVGVKSLLGLKCNNVNEIDIRILKYKVDKEIVELLKTLSEDTQMKACMLIRDFDVFKEFDALLSDAKQALLEIYTTDEKRGKCVSDYKEYVINLFKELDLKPFLQKLRETFPADTLQSLIKLGVKEDFISDLTKNLLSLESNIRRPVLKYLMLQLKEIEKLKKELVDECICAKSPAVFKSRITTFLENLRNKTDRLGGLLGKVKELEWLAIELSKASPISSLNDVVKIIKLIERTSSIESRVSEIEELIDMLLNNVTYDGEADLVKVYEEIKKCNKQELFDTLIRLCNEGAFKCVIKMR